MESDDEIVNAINLHFASITGSAPPWSVDDLKNYEPNSKVPFNVTEFDVFKQLSKLNVHKSNAPQAVPSRIFKECAIHFSRVIQFILMLSYATGKVPQSWKCGYITPLPKCSVIKSFNDLRPVTVTLNLAKIAEHFINKHLCSIIQPNLPYHQFGAVSKASTTHCLVELMDFAFKSIDVTSAP